MKDPRVLAVASGSSGILIGQEERISSQQLTRVGLHDRHGTSSWLSVKFTTNKIMNFTARMNEAPTLYGREHAPYDRMSLLGERLRLFAHEV